MRTIVAAVAAAVLVLMASVGGSQHADAARLKPVDPATCARVQAEYQAATGQTLTCEQVTYLWYSGAYPR